MFLLTLHYTKTETRHWRDEADAHWYLGPYFSGHHRRSQWQTWLHACVKAEGRHFEHLLWSPHSRLRVTSIHPKLVLFRATHTTERKTTYNFSVFYVCQVLYRSITKARWQSMYAFNNLGHWGYHMLNFIAMDLQTRSHFSDIVVGI